jgi:hypothetical protein
MENLASVWVLLLVPLFAIWVTLALESFGDERDHHLGQRSRLRFDECHSAAHQLRPVVELLGAVAGDLDHRLHPRDAALST